MWVCTLTFHAKQLTLVENATGETRAASTRQVDRNLTEKLRQFRVACPSIQIGSGRRYYRYERRIWTHDSIFRAMDEGHVVQFVDMRSNDQFDIGDMGEVVAIASSCEFIAISNPKCTWVLRTSGAYPKAIRSVLDDDSIEKLTWGETFGNARNVSDIQVFEGAGVSRFDACSQLSKGELHYQSCADVLGPREKIAHLAWESHVIHLISHLQLASYCVF